MKMKNKRQANLLVRSSLALAIALAIWCPIGAQSVKGDEEKGMREGKMTASCAEIMEEQHKMMKDMKAQDAELTEEVTRMNRARPDKKTEMMADILTRVVQQRSEMHVQMGAMQSRMMQHMMEHMQKGRESMSQCPMMKGMKDMDEKPGDAHKEHQHEVK